MKPPTKTLRYTIHKSKIKPDTKVKVLDIDKLVKN